jgi:hypothetical protein
LSSGGTRGRVHGAVSRVHSAVIESRPGLAWMQAGPGHGVGFNAVFPTDDPQLFASPGSGSGHLAMAVSPVPVPLWRLVFHSAPGRLVREGVSQVGSMRGTWLRVYPSSGGSVFSSHLVFLWTDGGHTYGIGFHGWGLDSRLMTLGIVRNLQWIAPAK